MSFMIESLATHVAFSHHLLPSVTQGYGDLGERDMGPWGSHRRNLEPLYFLEISQVSLQLPSFSALQSQELIENASYLLSYPPPHPPLSTHAHIYMSPHHVAVCSSATLTHHTRTQMGHSSSSIPKLSFCLIFFLVFPLPF